MEYHDYLHDILKAMKLTQEFTDDLTLQAFIADEKCQYAVIRSLEIIGEAVKRLSEEFRVNNPEIPWKAMAGMRDRLIHGYAEVDIELVWVTVKQTIPGLIPKIEKVTI